MNSFSFIISNIISGIIYGSLYAIVGLGIVLIYRSNKVLNFAIAPIGLTSAYIFYSLTNMGVALWPAFFLVILLGAGLGVIVKKTIDPVPPTLTLSRVMITIGWMMLLNSLTLLIYGQESKVIPSLFPTTSITLSIINVGVDQIWMLVICIIIVSIGGVVLKYSNYGKQLRAVSENSSAAELSGIDSYRVTMIAWAFGGGIASVAVILAARMLTLDPSIITSIVTITALAAAMFGGLLSLPLTLFGGILIAAAQGGIDALLGPIRDFLQPLGQAAPLILIVLVLLINHKKFKPLEIIGVSQEKHEQEKKSTGIRIGRIYVPLFPILSLLVLLLLPAFISGYWLMNLTSGLIMSIAVLSLIVLSGTLGQISFAQAAIMGMAAYTYSIFSSQWGWALVPSVFLSLLCAVLFSLIIAIPALRIKGLYLAITTYVFQVVVDIVLFSNQAFTGGWSGRVIARPEIFGITFSGDRSFYYLVIIIMVAVFLYVKKLPDTKLGRQMRAVRDSEVAAGTMGVNVTKIKISGFLISSFIAGLAGLLIASKSMYVAANQQFTTGDSLMILVLAVLLGIRSPIGAIIAGLLVGLPGAIITDIFRNSLTASKWIPVVFGLSLILNLITYPYGLAQMFDEFRSKKIHKKIVLEKT